jgi:putative ABC transport system substrate-binding protein
VQGLRDLGYVEGDNVVFEYGYTEGDPERRAREAARLVATAPDIIVAAAGSDAIALRKITSTIPIVVAVGADLVEMGLVASLARPGGNITGFQLFGASELAGKRLELLRLIAPTIRHVGVLRMIQPTEASRAYHARVVTALEVAARALNIRVTPITIDGAEGFDRAEQRVREEGVDALFVVGNPFMLYHRQRLAELAARHRLPAMYEVVEHPRAGGLMSYGANLGDLFRRAATYVDRILKGAKPADVPVEQPTKFERVINGKAAKALGLTIPQTLLSRADEVIQ